MPGVSDTGLLMKLFFFVKWSVNFQGELLSLLLTTSCNFAINVSDSFTPEASITDAELFIYFSYACKINLNIFPLLFLHLLASSKGEY